MLIVLPKKVQAQLDEVLEDDEETVDARKEPWSYTTWHRWTVLTDRRLIVIIRWPFGITYDVWPLYLKSLSVDMKEGFFFDTIYADYYTQKFKFEFPSRDRKKTMQFFHEINNQIMHPKVSKDGHKTEEVINEFEALAKIFYEKAISKEEYEKKKKELIDEL